MSPQTGAGASFGIGAVGSLFSGLGLAAEGKQEEAAYDYNAAVDVQNAATAMVANEQRYASIVGKQAIAYAAAGVDITSGSPLLMMAATAGRGGRQGAEIYEAGQEKATLERYYGKLAAWRGTFGGIQSFLGGLSKGLLQLAGATGYEGGGGGDTDSAAVAQAFQEGDWGVSGN